MKRVEKMCKDKRKKMNNEYAMKSSSLNLLFSSSLLLSFQLNSTKLNSI